MTEEEKAGLKHGDQLESNFTGNIYNVIDYCSKLVIFVDEDAHGVDVSKLLLGDYEVIKNKDDRVTAICKKVISKMTYQPRDPKRIDVVLSALKSIWAAQPDTRFNQLIHNLQFEFYKETGKGTYCTEQGKGADATANAIDLFSLEDEEFLAFLAKKRQQL